MEDPVAVVQIERRVLVWEVDDTDGEVGNAELLDCSAVDLPYFRAAEPHGHLDWQSDIPHRLIRSPCPDSSASASSG